MRSKKKNTFYLQAVNIVDFILLYIHYFDLSNYEM